MNALAPVPPGAVRIVEVGPRDGLQNEAATLSLDIKRELVLRLADAGLRQIEAGAFVSPRRVPQMADSGQLLRSLRGEARLQQVALPVLTPNLQGFEAAVAAGARCVAVFAAASETFSQRNIQCSIAESLRRFEPVLAAAQAAGMPVRGYLSCVVACPYEGAVAPAAVAPLAAQLRAMGCYEISLGDTIGAGTPGTVLPLLEAVARVVPVAALAGHFHDTCGMAVANVYAAHAFGLRSFDASVGGLGGVPMRRVPAAMSLPKTWRISRGPGRGHGHRRRRAGRLRRLDLRQLGRANSARAGAARLARRRRADAGVAQ